MSRVALGCMRLSTDEDRVESRALATILRAIDDGVEWLDTAHAYGRDDSERGHNERLVASALATCTSDVRARIRVVTKCGMTRPRGLWEPDGRAATIRQHAHASASALGRPADVLLLHAPDRSVPLATSLRALLRAMDDGHARAIGLSNVSRGQLDSIASVTKTPLAAVEVGLGAFEDAPARGGVVAWCKERGVRVLAHAPLGGPTRAPRLGRDTTLAKIALRHDVTPAMIVVAYLLALDDGIVPVVGARRPETAASALAAARIVLDEQDLARLDERFPGLGMVRRPPQKRSPHEATAEVVIVMGVAGSGKTRLAETYVARGYDRLNRDALGGTLRGIAKRLEQLLASGAKRVVLDNTYVTRAARSEVVRVAHAAGASVHCVHVDTPGGDVQVNGVLRMLERHGELLGGADLVKRAKSDANLFAPNALFRMERQLERPSEDEGFASIETIPFVRDGASSVAQGPSALLVPMELMLDDRRIEGVRAPVLRDGAAQWLARASSEARHILLYGWRPSLGNADVDVESAKTWLGHASAAIEPIVAAGNVVELGICTHASGPPVCWCRPPLPGLWVAFARRHLIDPRKSVLLATTPAHRSMAKSLGLAVVEPSAGLREPRGAAPKTPEDRDPRSSNLGEAR